MQTVKHLKRKEDQDKAVSEQFAIKIWIQINRFYKDITNINMNMKLQIYKYRHE